MRQPIPASLWSISILALLVTRAVEAKDDNDNQIAALGAIEWPAHLKYFPEDHIDDNMIRRRDREAVGAIIRDGAAPMEVRKMSEDEGEMFFPEYWGFNALGSPFTQGHKRSDNDKVRRHCEADEETLAANASAVLPFRPAFNIHETSLPPHDGRRALAALQRRAFTCPSGTAACSSIGEDNYCCGVNEDCYSIADTGLGPVGCCPQGVTCSGEITSCNIDAGQTPCPQDLGGACCVAGFSCFDVGCVSGLAVNPTFTVSPSTLPPPPPPPPPTTTTPPPPPPPPTTNVPPVVVPPPVTRQTDLPCNGFASFTECPPEIGGCCLSGRICAAGLLCPLPGETMTPLPPVRGTTEITTTTPPEPGSTIVPAPAPVPPPDYCPTGFYACSARYPGAGCCRIGRDCASTYCPETASATIISDGRTIVVPNVPAATTTAAGNCASGWTGCPAEAGGLCCPDGWACGTASCTGVEASATREVGKGQLVGAAGSLRWEKALLGISLGVVLVVVW